MVDKFSASLSKNGEQIIVKNNKTKWRYYFYPKYFGIFVIKEINTIINRLEDLEREAKKRQDDGK